MRLCFELFAAEAAARPDAVAVTHLGSTTTYRELNERSNRLARHLRRLGVGPEVLVGLSASRSVELVVAILAIHKAGGAYVPLDPTYPDARLAHIVADSGMTHLVVQGWEVDIERFHAFDGTLVDLRLDGEAIAAEAAADLETLQGPDDLAYVIYTSGSTGAPKGALITQRNLARLFTATDDWFGFGRHDVWTLFHSFAFDFSVWEFWGALAHGGRLVVVPQESTRSPEDFHRLLREERVTVLNQTPSAFSMLVRADREAPALTDLRCVVFGGEALEPRALSGWAERYGFDRPRLVNMYGITETTVHVTCHQLSARDVADGRSLIGEPIPDLRLSLLDPEGRPVPVGTPGEIHVSGAGVARGYLRRPELDAERFLTDPDDPSRRTYRSGDLARRLPDGGLEYCGRIDHQVKIRGFRIETGEVEAALLAHPDVRQALVLARSDPGGTNFLAGYVASDRADLDSTELRAHLARTLPSYMIPTVHVVMEQFPLTPNGKVDRGLLPEPGGTGRPAARIVPATPTTPTTPTERLVAAVWADVLGRPAAGIGSDDSFLEWGGHSLAAARVAHRLRAELGRAVPVRLVYDHPRLSAFAAALDSRAQPGAAVARPTGRQEPRLPAPGPVDRRSDRSGSVPLTAGQRRMWFAMQLDPTDVAYNLQTLLRLRGSLDTAALRGAVRDLVERHAVLRSVVAQEHGTPVAVALDPEAVPVDLLDTAPAALDSVLRADIREPFALDAEPPLRVRLHRLGEDDHLLALTIHHIATDARSEEILLRELSACYNARVGSGPSPEPPILDHADYAVWEAARDSREFDEDLRRWVKRLTGLADLELPTDRARPAVADWTGDQVPLSVSGAAVRSVAARTGCSPFMVLLTAWQLLLGRLAGATEFAIGVAHGGRVRDGLDDVVGFFVNTVVVRADLAGAETRGEALRRTRERVLEAFDSAEVPFDLVVRAVGPQRNRAGTPIFQTMLTLLDAREPIADFGPARAERVAAPVAAALVDLALTLTETDSDFRGALTYRTDLFDAATVQGWAASLAATVEELERSPDGPVGLSVPGSTRSGTAAASTGPDAPRPAGRDRTRRAPVSPLELLVARVWSGVLPGAEIGADDDFFTLGGHSLAATDIAYRLRDALGCPVPVRALFDHPVLAEYALAVERIALNHLATEAADHEGAHA